MANDMRGLANSYLLIGIVLNAIWPIALQVAGSINVYEFLFLENAVAVVGSLLLLKTVRRRSSIMELLKSRRALIFVAIVALLNYAVPDFGMLLAEHLISASLAAVTFRSYPILMLLFIPFVLKERTTKYQFASLAIAFAAIFLVIYPLQGPMPSGGALLGIGLALVAALSNALALVIMKRYVHETENALFLFNLIGFALFAVLFIANGLPLGAISTTGWLAILYAGLLYSVVSAYGFYFALKTLKTTVVTNLYFFVPFVTFIFANLLLGQPFSLYCIIPAIMLVCSMLVQKLDKKGGTYATQRKGLDSMQIFDVTGAFIRTEEQEIASLIRSGGRAFAVKVNHAHSGFVEELSKENTTMIITRTKNKLVQEMKFIDEVLGTGADEIAVVVAGGNEECEEVLENISARLSGSGTKN